MLNGTRWLKADLHMHTPGKGQYFTLPSGEKVPENEEEKVAFAKRYLQEAHERAGLDLIAVTNHNDTSWIDPLRIAARELYKDRFVVLPGLEIGADSGLGSIHVLAIFPEDVPVQTLERLLEDDLELPMNKRFTLKGDVLPSPKSFTDTARAVKKRGGIVVAAHVFSSQDSLLGSSSNQGQSRIQQFLCPELLGLDLASFTLEQLMQKNSSWGFYIATNQHKDASCRRATAIALLNNSDARKLEDVGSQYTWIKGDRPCFTILRNALLNPVDRLRLKDNPPVDEKFWTTSQPWIFMPPITANKFLGRLEVENSGTGFLCDTNLSFHPGINCLIGGRGSGKSAIVELLRYLWGQQPLLSDKRGFEDVFLPETGTAKVEVYSNGSRYRVVRSGRATPLVERFSSNTWEVVSNLKPEHLFPLSIYGQKEILHTSKDVRIQLDLLDRLVGEDLQQLKHQNHDLLERLRQNREQILTQYREWKRLHNELEELPKVEEQLRTWHERGIEEKAKLKQKYDREKQIWLSLSNQLKELDTTLIQTKQSVALDLSAVADEKLADLPNSAQMVKLRERLDQLNQELSQGIDTLSHQFAQAVQDANNIQTDCSKSYTDFEVDYRDALGSIPGINPDNIAKLERRRAELEQSKHRLHSTEKTIEEKIDDRTQLINDLLCNAQAQFQMRESKAKEISARTSRIRINVTQGGDKLSLIQLLHDNLTGSRIQRRYLEPIAQYCSNSLLPILALIEQTDVDLPAVLKIYQHWDPKESAADSSAAQRLTEIAGFTNTDGAIKFAAFLDCEKRLQLDEFIVPDKVTIELNIAKEGQSDNWRPLGKELGQGVSVGQGCTAILSIILLESEIPLIIDQPEDDLDNRFIYDEVVQLLRRERGRRQIIIATHNANLPVAGDAEMIIALDTEENTSGSGTELRCKVEAAGFIDQPNVNKQVALILEGGEEALRLRYQKYGF